MSKKDKKKSIGSAGGITLQPTSKFTVLDAPNVTQPKIEDAVANDASSSPSAADAAAKTTQKEGQQGRRAKASTGPRMSTSTSNLIGGDSYTARVANPTWIQQRQAIYEQVAQRRAEELASKTPVPIQVTLPDGKVLKEGKDGTAFVAWKTSPYNVAATISQGLADSAVVARVTYADLAQDYSLGEDGMDTVDTLGDAMADGGLEEKKGDEEDEEGSKTHIYLWDMTRPLVGNVAKLEFLKFEEDQDAKTVFWHSSAHMLGEALEHLYGCRLTIGPPLAGGFYYDSYMASDSFHENDCELEIKLS